MEVSELQAIIKSIKAQLKYERTCCDAAKMMFPDCLSPIMSCPLWEGFSKVLDCALGLEAEEFTSWWIWETNCGQDERMAVIYFDDGIQMPVRNAEEIIKYSEYRKNQAK